MKGSQSMQMWLMPMIEELLRGIVAVVALVVVAHGRRADVRCPCGPCACRTQDREPGWPVFRSTCFTQLTVSSSLLAEIRSPLVAVERVDDAVAIRMGQKLAHLARLVLLLREDHDVDAGVVPLVVGRLLVAELGLARVGVAAPDGHGPLVVAGTHGLVPRRRVARAVVEEVRLRVIGVPAPVRAAADLPGVAFPGARAETLLAVVRVGAVEVVARGRLPHRDRWRTRARLLLAGLDVVGGGVAANAELCARRADEQPGP